MTDDSNTEHDSNTKHDSNAGEMRTTSDEMRTTTVAASAPKATMGEFSHSNPYTGETFGDEMAFERGPAVAADGGRGDAEPADGAQTMKDVDHEHPHEDAADANRVFARGHADDEDEETSTDSERTGSERTDNV